MIKIGIVGDIGSGKSFIAKQFGFPVFNADREVNKIYKYNKNCFKSLKNQLPKYIFSFPIKKKELSKAVAANKQNLKNEFKFSATTPPGNGTTELRAPCSAGHRAAARQPGRTRRLRNRPADRAVPRGKPLDPARAA